MKKRTHYKFWIKNKILLFVISISLAGLLLPGLGSLFSMWEMREDIILQNGSLGVQAARDSGWALRERAEQQLKTLSKEIARLSDEKLLAIENQTRMVANMAEHIYSHPDLYSLKETKVDYLPQDKAGQFSLYIKTAPGVSKKSIQKELNLISNISSLLCEIKSLDLNIKACYIGSASGFQLSADKNSQGPDSRDFPVTKRPWYKGAAKAGGLYWTDWFPDFNTGRLCIDCAMPYYDRSKPVSVLKGVAVSEATTEQLRAIIGSAAVGKTGQSFLVNEKGNIIISREEIERNGDELVYKNLLKDTPESVRALAQTMSREKEGLGQVQWNGKKVLMAYYRLSVVPWTMVTVVDVDEILEPACVLAGEIQTLTGETTDSLSRDVYQTAVRFVTLLAFFVLATVLLSFCFAKKLTGPLGVLTQNVQALSKGGLDVPMKTVTTNDEIEVLSEAFLKMKTELKTYIQNIADITAEKERIGAELHVATQIQASMLPCIFPAFPERKEFDIYASMRPAKEVGGDFYDFFLTDEAHLAVVMADVSGKGVPAALFMVIAKTLIKNQTQAGYSPEEVFNVVNTQLCENNEAGMFVTAWMGILEIGAGRLICVNAGHNPPLLRRAGGDFEYIEEKPGFVLAGMEGVGYEQMEIPVSGGDELYLYTDGVTEAANLTNELYGEKRLKAALDKNREAKPEALLAAVREDIGIFVGNAPQFDDITMLALRING